MTDEAIRFTFQIHKMQTLVDGGWSMTIHFLPPTGEQAIMDLSKCKRPGIILECAALAINIETIKKEEGFSLAD